ncbi:MULTISPECIES: helix-turn-helix transcriptional regulator [Tatumella]|uniref:ArsR/SmtB family transcription factor n=1 Tax=Tatumella punctata TaxID=399969 RepID=A0ABW1VJN6_9GAMM|nr:MULTISPECIES: helix-turn-helix transcriptional regulator [unclassified Tatumella]MBS0877065.1 helix-turn-helix transcriptional regulator [Tatumella sp. JGM82]MBS0890667.1 helix-turn-helix transcriptional regulator [Tatumella sp. JGM94]MBS0893338.1 helix-turn-helix transcriptional regulator [Tatumella sp. JGM130]MBS0901368.1 helix-turn-helix transcriptional regulator [Tatumella sp. JGM100]
MTPENAIKLLANPTRMSVLQWLKDPHTAFAGYSQLYDFPVYGVCASLISEKAGLSQPATSLCLKALSEAGLLEASKVGKWTYYRRNETMIRQLTAVVVGHLQTL